MTKGRLTPEEVSAISSAGVSYKWAATTCIEEAAKCTSTKRKVGAIIVKNGLKIGQGHNHTHDGSPCEVDGKTTDKVIHAEVSAINNANDAGKDTSDSIMFVTHEPCAGCSAAIKSANIKMVILIDNFIKFDHDKLRYDLIPPEVSLALAEVLTYGARKYKPDNWKHCEDKGRYIAALMRHLEAYRLGELMDKESGLSHTALMLCNAAFLTYFDSKDRQTNRRKRNRG